MKKSSYLILGLLFLALMVPLTVALAAGVQISPVFPGTKDTNCLDPSSATCNPVSFVNNFYSFALLIGGVLAFAAVVFGGVKYITAAGNPSGQSEGKEWITSALLGLLLLGGAFFILKVINPELVNLQLLSSPSVSPGGTLGAGAPVLGGLTQAQAGQQLAAAKIPVSSTGNCSDPNNTSCTSLAGMQQATIDELVKLKQACRCDVTVTGGTERGHGAVSDVNHANGFKADVALNTQLDKYIMQTPDAFTSIGTRSDGAPMWRDKATGAIYALEQSKNHWDITVPPK